MGFLQQGPIELFHYAIVLWHIGVFPSPISSKDFECLSHLEFDPCKEFCEGLEDLQLFSQSGYKDLPGAVVHECYEVFVSLVGGSGEFPTDVQEHLPQDFL